MAVTESPPTLAQRLDEAEAAAQQQIDQILAGTTLTGAALLAAEAALLAAILAPARTALQIGAETVLAGTRRRTGTGRLTEQPLPTPVDRDLSEVLADAALRVDAADDPAAEWERARKRLHRLAATKIHQAKSSGAFMYARWLGLGLRWVARTDGRACPSCAAMHGRTAGPGERFTPSRGRGIPRTAWKGFRGLPPLHPWCRCALRPVRP